MWSSYMDVCTLHTVHNVCIGIPREYVTQWWRRRGNRHHRCHDPEQQHLDSTGRKKTWISICAFARLPLPKMPCHPCTHHYVSGENPFCVYLIATHYSIQWVHEAHIKKQQKRWRRRRVEEFWQKRRDVCAIISTRIFECESHFPCERE